MNVQWIGARFGHFDDSHDAASSPVCSAFGTTNPEPLRGWLTPSRAKASAMVAADAYGIWADSCVSATSRSRISVLGYGVVAVAATGADPGVT